MTAAIRLTYRNHVGETVVEDLVGPSAWSPLQYHSAIRRQRPGIEVLNIEPVTRELEVPNNETTTARWWVTLRTPGRPRTTVLLTGGYAEVRRLALMGAEAGPWLIPSSHGFGSNAQAPIPPVSPTPWRTGWSGRNVNRGCRPPTAWRRDCCGRKPPTPQQHEPDR